MLAYKVTTDSATEPLDKTEVRLQLKNEGITADNDLLDIYIKAARQMAEDYTNTALIIKTIEQVYEMFPVASENNPHAALKLAVSPLSSVSTLHYKDGDGTDVLIESTNYDVNNAIKPGLLAPKPNYSWPTVYNGLNAVKAVYVAGYADAASVPTPIKQAMLLSIAHWYRKRIDTPRSMPTQAEFLLNPYRVTEF